MTLMLRCSKVHVSVSANPPESASSVMNPKSKGKPKMAKKNMHDTTETVENAMKNGAEAMKTGFEAATKSFDRWIGFSRENMEA
ncbi:MAG TPA: hypothetical protein DCL48_07045, partial [Alphaproteobacteria bacterium]|nr:hypothetical protein [Alphaproteobacteria bacterium]